MRLLLLAWVRALLRRLLRREDDMDENLKRFGKVAFGVTKVLVPGVAEAERTIRGAASGEQRRKTVLDSVTSYLVEGGYLSNPAVVIDPEFQEGLRGMNDGAVKIMRALARLEK